MNSSYIQYLNRLRALRNRSAYAAKALYPQIERYIGTDEKPPVVKRFIKLANRAYDLSNSLIEKEKAGFQIIK